MCAIMSAAEDYEVKKESVFLVSAVEEEGWKRAHRKCLYPGKSAQAELT